MSLWDVYEQHEKAPTRAELADALAGNLCRCTGYRPILDAGEKMYEAPRQVRDKTALLAALSELAGRQPAPDGALGSDQPGARFYAPTQVDDLARLRAALPDARLLAGGTDIGLWVTKQFRDLGDIIYLGEVSELQSCTLLDEATPGACLEIGAAVSLEQAWG